MKRENTDSWNFGPEIATSEIPILQSFKWPEILRRFFIEYIKNTGEKKYQRGPTSCPQGNRARPPGRALMPCGANSWPPAPSFCYIRSFALKNYREDFRDETPPSRGRTWAGSILLSGGAIPPGILPSGRGKSKPSTSPTILSSWEDQSSSTSSPAPSRLKP